MKRSKPLYILCMLIITVLVFVAGLAFAAGYGNFDALKTGKVNRDRKSFWEQILEDFDWNNFPWETFPFEEYDDFPWSDLPWEEMPNDFDWNNMPWEDLPQDFPWENIPWEEPPADFPWQDVPWEEMPDEGPWQDVPWGDVSWDNIPWDNLPPDFPWGDLNWSEVPEDFPWEKMPWDDLPEDFPWEELPWENLGEDFPWEKVPWGEMDENFPWERLPWQNIPPDMLPLLGIPWLLVPPDAIPEGALPDGFFPWDHTHTENPFVPWELIRPATCGEDGEERNYCIVCKQEMRRVIPATGAHVYNEEHMCTQCNRYLIILVSGSASGVYGDGPVRNTELRFAEGSAQLLPGHSLRAAFAELGMVGKRTNVFSVTVVDGEGNDVSSRYIIQKVYGALELAKREITIVTEGAQKPYDGEPLENHKWTVEGAGLAPGDVLEVEFGEGQTDYGWRENEIVDYRIVNENGEDVTANYAVKTRFGKLTVGA